MDVAHLSLFGRLPVTARAIGATAFAALLTLGAAPAAQSAAAAGPPIPVCPGPAAPGSARCHAEVLADSQVRPLASRSPTGLSPATIKSAYNLSSSSTAGAGQTIAIVDAYDDPTAENDLNVFSVQYNLPACTTANGCFTKVDQRGGETPPRADAASAGEVSPGGAGAPSRPARAAHL